MFFASADVNSKTVPVIVQNGLVYPLDEIQLGGLLQHPYSLFSIIRECKIPELKEFLDQTSLEEFKQVLPMSEVRFRPPYPHPRKIWGIGLNYRDHAHDLAEEPPQGYPASFMKPDTTIIGMNDTILIPAQSQKTTGEAELGVVIGKNCRDIEPDEWLDYVAGFVPIIDMTAEDILRQNPRYLTLSKSFDTFFSYGPCLLTPEEVPDVFELRVATVHNGKVWAENYVKNMTFTPDKLVSLHSKVMTLNPGDIISTGTPRAVPLNHGDTIECRINGFPPLKNYVCDQKTLTS